MLRPTFLKTFIRRLKVTATELKRGDWIRYNNKPHSVLASSSMQSGRNCRIYSLQLKPIDADSVLSLRPSANETFERTAVVDVAYKFMYEDGDSLVLANAKTYDEVCLPRSKFPKIAFEVLEAGQVFKVRFDEANVPVCVEQPRNAECTVARMDLMEDKKGIATVQGGMHVTCPGFIKVGDKIVVDLENRSYVTRVEDLTS